MRRRVLCARAIASGVALVSAAGRAPGASPDRPIALIVAAPAGGGTDLIARHDTERQSIDDNITMAR